MQEKNQSYKIWDEKKGEIAKSTDIFGDFNIPLSTTWEKIRKSIEEIKNIVNQQNLIDIYRTDRAWDGWMVSLTQWTWVWKSSGRWWRTGNLCVLQSMGSQRVGHNWATEQQPPSILWSSHFLILNWKGEVNPFSSRDEDHQKEFRCLTNSGSHSFC